MIVPLKATITALDQEESFSQGEELAFGQPRRLPRYRVKMTAFDTNKREVREWEFWSMEDRTRGFYDQVGQVQTRAPLFVDVVAMRELRKELDKALEDEPLPRWGRFSDEEMAELASLISAAGESYDLTPSAEKLWAEVAEESDNRKTRSDAR